ncbi:VRR-NUC domain-containing protein [Oxalobacteraceae bacterium R-40]|uniref:phosphodiesterase I n=1 Tax=Keguizhuia sedimenti TaxID=3064264 RepID=A0ABU1BQF5_9BURK|nr:VRR-NUC domain-containing protein [Oxalobacteraceae bacterium R-40]
MPQRCFSGTHTAPAASLFTSMKTLPNPLYYLENFHLVLDWIRSRYSDLLIEDELAWIDRFSAMPQNARALLVRFVMRKGNLFRSGKLVYDEIGCPHEAACALVAAGWVDADPLLDPDLLYGLLKKAELLELLKPYRPSASAKKTDLLDLLHEAFPEPVSFGRLHPESTERIYRLSDKVEKLCRRLRLMFFGNPYQDWTEFVLADLGIYLYEKVRIDDESRGFRRREDVDAYLHLHALRERFDAGEEAEIILRELGEPAIDNEWIAGRRAKFLYQIAQFHEQRGELSLAMDLYRQCRYPGARLRCVRIHEKTGDHHAAYALAQSAEEAPENEAERQQLERILPRLRRKLGLPKNPIVSAKIFEEWTLILPRPEQDYSVEMEVCRLLSTDNPPVYYVENAMINSLFGLLCWDAIFHPMPGAFFHPFHTGPADLHAPDFYTRRKELFDACFSQLDSDAYKTAIRKRFTEKSGRQSPFVFWGALDEEMLELALDCIPADHLRHWFNRVLQDIKSNRNGFPDLIQFWPQEGRYRMIEVKAPGDRLQDNQLRMLDFAIRHGMPVSVCYVVWSEPAT